MVRYACSGNGRPCGREQVICPCGQEQSVWTRTVRVDENKYFCVDRVEGMICSHDGWYVRGDHVARVGLNDDVLANGLSIWLVGISTGLFPCGPYLNIWALDLVTHVVQGVH